MSDRAWNHDALAGKELVLRRGAAVEWADSVGTRLQVGGHELGLPLPWDFDCAPSRDEWANALWRRLRTQDVRVVGVPVSGGILVLDPCLALLDEERAQEHEAVAHALRSEQARLGRWVTQPRGTLGALRQDEGVTIDGLIDELVGSSDESLETQWDHSPEVGLAFDRSAAGVADRRLAELTGASCLSSFQGTHRCRLYWAAQRARCCRVSR